MFWESWLDSSDIYAIMGCLFICQIFAVQSKSNIICTGTMQMCIFEHTCVIDEKIVGSLQQSSVRKSPSQAQNFKVNMLEYMWAERRTFSANSNHLGPFLSWSRYWVTAVCSFFMELNNVCFICMKGIVNIFQNFSFLSKQKCLSKLQ